MDKNWSKKWEHTNYEKVSILDCRNYKKIQELRLLYHGPLLKVKQRKTTS